MYCTFDYTEVQYTELYWMHIGNKLILEPKMFLSNRTVRHVLTH